MIRVAVLSFWHVHARDYAREAIAHSDVELAAIWDEDPARGRIEADQRGTAFVPDLPTILTDRAIDAVVVTTSTAAHPEIIAAALTAGKPVFTEKVLAATLREAIVLRNQARQAGLALEVALARTEIPEMIGIKRLIDEGQLGKLTAARVRVAHGGAVPSTANPTGWLPARFLEPEEACGGAMIDLGAHPLYLTRLLLGMPSEITALFGHVAGKAGDDNSAALLGYDSGAIGIAETGFVSSGSPVAVEAHGFSGSAIANAARAEIECARQDESGQRVWTFEPFDPTPRPTPFEGWIGHLQAGTLPDLDLALDLSALAEAAALSAKTGVRVRLDQLDGWEERA
jgi:1,5-anhydro-D-fructose reductase (1,5-anhydro-D-mannitol-forming)